MTNPAVPRAKTASKWLFPKAVLGGAGRRARHRAAHRRALGPCAAPARLLPDGPAGAVRLPGHPPRSPNAPPSSEATTWAMRAPCA